MAVIFTSNYIANPASRGNAIRILASEVMMLSITPEDVG
jgi:hypothetical protein